MTSKVVVAIPFVFLSFLSGCATNSGVVPIGQDRGEALYTVARQGNGAWVPTSELKDQALQEAGAFCGTTKGSLRVIHTEETPARPFGGWPQGKVLFSCGM
jgi:hypothetical protein